MNSDFYLLLPSDGCVDIHPNNLPNQFTITLNEAIALPGREWEVAICEFYYINAIKPLSRGEWIRLYKSDRRAVLGHFTCLPYMKGKSSVKKEDFSWYITHRGTGTIIGRIFYEPRINRFKAITWLDEWQRNKHKETYQFRLEIHGIYAAQLGFISPRYEEDTRYFNISDEHMGDRRVHIAKYRPSPLIRIDPLSGIPTLVTGVGFKRTTTDLHPQGAHYKTLSDLLGEFTERTQKEYGCRIFMNSGGRVEVEQKTDTKIELHDGMQDLLGFDKSPLIGHAIAEHLPHFKPDTIAINCSILEEQRVGETQKERILGDITLPLQAEQNEPVCVTLQTRRYLPLASPHIRDIHIELVDAFNKAPITFVEGKTMLLLHFREKRRDK